MRLRTTLFALLVVIAVVLSATVYVGFDLQKADVIEQEEAGLAFAAETVASNLDERVTERQVVLRTASGEPEAAAHGSDEQWALAERVVDRTPFHGVSITNDEGEVQALTGEGGNDEDLVVLDLSDREYVKRALDGEEYVSEPFTAETGNDIIVVSAPILEDGEIVGAFSGAIHYRNVAFFAPTHDMLAKDHVVTVSTGDRLLYESGAPPDEVLVEEAVVPDEEWTVVVTADRAALDERLLRITLAQAGGILLSLLSVGFVGLWFSRTTLQSLDELIQGMDELEAGNYDTTVELGAVEEWKRLNRQFNGLADALEERESQLQVLNRVLRHNLRNDMSVVIAHADTILHEEPDDETTRNVRKIRETASKLIDTSEHARAIYEELLVGTDRKHHPVDLVTVLESIYERHTADRPGCTIESELPDTAWTYGPEAVPIIVEELCWNAIAHNDKPPEERVVDVAVDTTDDEVVLTVRDNGPGLPAVERELLNGDRQPTDIEHGSGLGLWVVTWLVGQLDGKLETLDEAAWGTAVRVRLPRAEPPE